MKKRQLAILTTLLTLGVLVLLVSIKLVQEANNIEMYHLTTRWFFHAPIDRVWAELTTNDEQWKKAASQGNGMIGIGTFVDNEVKGDLPYTLRFRTEITRYEPPFVIEATSSGDLVGKGTWVLEARDGGTEATFYWDVGMSNPILNLLSKIPFVKSAMAENHDQVMAEDYLRTRAKLEGVPGPSVSR